MLKLCSLQQLTLLAVSMLFSVQALGILHLKPWPGLHPVQEIIPLYDFVFAFTLIGIHKCLCNMFRQIGTDRL